MWQPETCPIVYAIASSASPNAKATPYTPILSAAMIALPGPMIISTAVPTASAPNTRMFDCPVGEGVSARGAAAAVRSEDEDADIEPLFPTARGGPRWLAPHRPPHRTRWPAPFRGRTA